MAFVEADFEPRPIIGIPGVYFSRARIRPNMIGEITVSVINVSEKEVELSRRTRVRKLAPPSLNDLTT